MPHTTVPPAFKKEPKVSEKMPSPKKTIEIMDTTLSDGEQTSGVSFSVSEKLTMAKLLLDELKVDRIEIASARVSEGEFQSVKQIVEWASTKDI